MSKFKVKSGKHGDTRQVMNIFNFDLKLEKLIYCSVKVNSPFLSKVTQEKWRTTKGPGTNQQKASKKTATNQQQRIKINAQNIFLTRIIQRIAYAFQH